MKTNLDKFFKTDSNLQKTGVWFDIDDKTGFLVIPINSNNKNWRQMYAQSTKPYVRQMELGTMDPAKEIEITCRVFVETALLDWKGVEIDGVDIPYSKEAARKFLNSMPTLLDALIKYAMDNKNYLEDANEAVGNS